jgi:biotin carboxyl carrier protein
MAKTIELTVPDLGGFDDVPIIEILIAAGDTIAKDAPLVTLESDKATMEVPASAAGTVRDVKVKIGDRVSQGTVLANVDVADDAPAQTAAQPSAPPSAAAGPVAPVAAGAANEAAELAAPDSSGSTAPDSSGSTAPDSSGSTQLELIVPDLGGFDDVPIITIFVQAGDTIAKDAPLVELESDKATMEVPAAYGGVCSAGGAGTNGGRRACSIAPNTGSHHSGAKPDGGRSAVAAVEKRFVQRHERGDSRCSGARESRDSALRARVRRNAGGRYRQRTQRPHHPR